MDAMDEIGMDGQMERLLEQLEIHSRFPRYCENLKKAIEDDKWETAVELLASETFSLHAVDQFCKPTPLVVAIKLGRLKFVELLVGHGSSLFGQSFPPLHQACAEGNKDIVRFLLKAGAGINEITIGSLTPLGVAAGARKVEIVNLLLASGADIVVERSYRACPLYQAVKHLKVEGMQHIATILVRHGINVNTRNKKNGRTTLFWALQNDDKASARMLIECGARLGPTAHSTNGLIENGKLDEGLMAQLNSPSSLKSLCLQSIRMILVKKYKQSILEHLAKLPLPPPLIKYVTLDKYDKPYIAPQCDPEADARPQPQFYHSYSYLL